jgi:[Skp1-protein]-hydroxyproline N-acetylglucosaminyltransferase
MAKLCGWTPKTEHLLHLHDDRKSSSSTSSGGGVVGYDIIDHAFEAQFSEHLLHELRANGWIGNRDNKDGGDNNDRLSPARTALDVNMQSLLGGFLDKNNNSDASGSNIRGDESAFISREERSQSNFHIQYPYLHRLVSSIENTVTNKVDTEQEIFEFDVSLTSVQLARYNGDAISGYPRHCDRGMTCAKEYSINHNNNANSKTDKKVENEGVGMQRLLTFVYYLTPNDWDAKLDGGALRMYNPSSSLAPHDIDKKENDEYFDITPHSGRLVVFRSDIIEHEVMPSNRRERIAITVWLYGQRRRKEVVHDDHLWKEGKEEDAIRSRDEVVLPPILNNALPPPLPMIPEESTAQKQQQLIKESTIFVAIPSYRDVETFPTIQSLIETAAFPQRIYIGVVFQVDTSSSSNNEVEQFTSGKEYTTHLFNKYRWNKQTHLRTITLDYRHATGPCYARHLAQSLHRGEHYILQIDSHMRFRPNWDTYLIHQLDLCPVPSMSVLTTYPPNYDPPYGPGVHAETRGTILVPWKFHKNDGMLRQKGRLLNEHHNNSNIPCHLFAAGFNFFQSSLLDLCPYDGKLHGLFFGEEISMAVRLYTHGVDLYAPPMTVCYHKWKRNALRKPTAVSSTGGTDEEEDDPTSLGREASLNVVRSQLRGTGRGLGDVRTVKQFEDAIGVDFEARELSPGCENVGLDDDAFVSTSTGQIMIMADADNNEVSDNNMANNDVSMVMSLVSQFMGSNA